MVGRRLSDEQCARAGVVKSKPTMPPIRDREDLRESRTPDADLRALDVEPGIAARDDLDPGVSTEVVREKDQVVPQARRREDE